MVKYFEVIFLYVLFNDILLVNFINSSVLYNIIFSMFNVIKNMCGLFCFDVFYIL